MTRALKLIGVVRDGSQPVIRYDGHAHVSYLGLRKLTRYRIETTNHRFRDQEHTTPELADMVLFSRTDDTATLVVVHTDRPIGDNNNRCLLIIREPPICGQGEHLPFEFRKIQLSTIQVQDRASQLLIDLCGW